MIISGYLLLTPKWPGDSALNGGKTKNPNNL